MERDQKTMTMTTSTTKFVCKFCNKRYPCGKSLGGHLRSHRIGPNLSEESWSRASELGVEVGGSSGYGLRANPKKTRRFRDSSSVGFHQQGYSNVCKECGKGFQSLKALCGHMACHSEKASDWFKEEEEEDGFEDEEDGTDRSGEGKKQFKPVSDSDQSNEYCSVSEIEQEQEELAKCLMMLSRDDPSRRAPNSSGSLVLESKSSPIRVRVRAVGGLSSPSGFDEDFEMRKLQKRKLKSTDSGYMRYEDEYPDSDSSTDEHLKIKRLGKPKRSRDINSAAHFGKKHNNITDYTNQPPPRKRVSNDLISHEDGSSCRGDFSFALTHSKEKHQCEVCYKLFDSRKALSGHKSASSCYRKAEPFRPPEPNKEANKLWSSKNLSGDLKKKFLANKKSYRHECPICFRVFKSGQALGGHKRSHFLGSSEDRSMTIVSEINKVPSLIDLNLPAPIEEDGNGVPGSGCAHSYHLPLLGCEAL